MRGRRGEDFWIYRREVYIWVREARSKVFVNGVISSVFACRMITQEGNNKNEKIDSVFEPRSATL